MTKLIHLIMIGTKPTLSDTEFENIKRIKEIYPDWELKIWGNEDCIGWIRESPFASYYFDKHNFAFVSDYLRNKILEEKGGLYMDTDVYCANRVPDKYFEKGFMAWDVIPGTNKINNGTCLYSPKPHDPIFVEFEEVMRNGEHPLKSGISMDFVNSVLLKHGWKREAPDCCEYDQDLGDFVIVNRSQFGVRGKDGGGYITNGKAPYFIHSCYGSWVIGSFSSYVNLKYAILDENTDWVLLKHNLRKVVAERKKTDIVIFLMASPVILDEEIHQIVEPLGELFNTYAIPSEYKNQRKIAFDYIVKRVNDIKSCTDIMREKWTK